MNKIELIKALLELVEEEKKYEKEYHEEYKKLESDKNTPKWKWEQHWNKKVPQKAMSKDALRIIARLSFLECKNK